MSTILAVSPAIKSDWSTLVAQRKADKAAERARNAAQEVETARERARAALLNRAVLQFSSSTLDMSPLRRSSSSSDSRW